MKLHRYQFQPLDKEKLVNPDKETLASASSFMKGGIAPVLSSHYFSGEAPETPEPPPSPEPPVLIGYREEDLLRSRTEGYEEGYAKGFCAAKSAAEEQEKQLLETVRALIHAIHQKETHTHEIHSANIDALVDVTFSSARVLAGAALERFASDEIRRILTEVIKQQYDAPQLTLFVSDQLLSNVLHWIDSVRAHMHFTGAIHVHGLAHLPLSDCRVEWQNGGVKREWKMLESELFNALKTTLVHSTL